MTPRNDSGVSRRRFLGQTAAVLAGTTAGLRATADRAMPTAILGRTNVEVSRMGIGCAQFQRPHITVDDTTAAIHRALELGINYFDVAPNYATGDSTSEAKMGPAVKERRDEMFLVTKTEEPDYAGTWRLLRQSLERLQTDHVDLVHLHNFGNEDRFGDLELVFGDQGAMGALREARDQGVVRFIGASGHLHPTRFNAALDTGEIDVLMNAVNFIVQHTYNFEGKVWERAARENIGLVAMKVLGGQQGNGFAVPQEHYESAIRYALSIPGCHCCVIGTPTLAELEQAATTVMTSALLSESDRMELAGVGRDLAVEGRWPAIYGNPLT